MQGKKQNCNQNARCQAAAMWLKCFNKRSEVATIKLAVLDCDQQSLLSRDPLQRHVDESSGLGRSQSTLYQLRLCRTLFICLFSTAICLILQNYNMLGGQSSLLSNPPLISRPGAPAAERSSSVFRRLFQSRSLQPKDSIPRQGAPINRTNIDYDGIIHFFITACMLNRPGPYQRCKGRD